MELDTATFTDSDHHSDENISGTPVKTVNLEIEIIVRL